MKLRPITLLLVLCLLLVTLAVGVQLAAAQSPTKTPVAAAPPTKTALPESPAQVVPTKTDVPLPTKTDVPLPTKTQVPPTAVPPTAVPPTAVPPTQVPPTDRPPTDRPDTAVPATEVPPTPVPPTPVPPTASGGGQATRRPVTQVPATAIPASSAPQSPSPIPPTRTPRFAAQLSPTPADGGGGINLKGPVLPIAGGVLGVLLLGGLAFVLLRKRKPRMATGMETAAGPAKLRQVKPEQVRQLVGAFRSLYTVRPEVLQALEAALRAVGQPLRAALEAELAAYWRGDRPAGLFTGLATDADKDGYLAQFVAVISQSEASKESVLEALKQLEERIAPR